MTETEAVELASTSTLDDEGDDMTVYGEETQKPR